MAKFKEWHLRREQGVWCVYHVPHYVQAYGGSLSTTYNRVASSPDINQAIRLGRHHAADLAMLKLSRHA